ncbi:MAG: diguanylate cyclase [Candidatus Limnocylindria bacterium]
MDQATRLALRRTVKVGAPLVTVGLGADALQLVLRFGAAGLPSAGLDVMAAVMVVSLAIIGIRFLSRPEPAVMGMLLVVYGVALLNTRLLPVIVPATTGYLVLTLVGSALFVGWSPRWHTAWLAGAFGLTAAAVGGSLAAGFAPAEVASELIALAAAGLASMVGHPLAYLRSTRMLVQQFELRRLSRLAQRQDRDLAALNTELMRTARLDTVTGIGNRRALDEALEALAGSRLAAVLLDVDHFKAFNDRNGHLAGDAALARVGELLRDTVRQRDMVFRYGGEEFLILIPGGDREGAARLAERVRQAVEADSGAGQWGLTVSAGVAVADRFSASSQIPLLRRADAALYQAKRAGRNRVAVDDATTSLSQLAT